ncbi:MAG TPA: LapA family protein [Alphaproteobacteria bacterium]|nr:LapA family protein [Alphaproteobacteria bacterium]
MKHFSWLVTLPVTLAVVVFAISNRTPVEIDLFPLPWRPVLPAFLLVLASLFLGFLIGGAVAWLAGAPRRRRARRLAIEADVLSRELAEVRRKAADTVMPAPTGIPSSSRAGSTLATPPV